MSAASNETYKLWLNGKEVDGDAEQSVSNPRQRNLSVANDAAD
jgi:hypothetical protein